MVDIVFRTAGAWGAGKGSNLTPAEVDQNFFNIKDWIESFEPEPPNGISNITMVGAQLTFYTDNGSSYGPFTVPAPPALIQVETEETAARSLVLADRNKYIRCTHASGCAISVPASEDVDFPLGSEIHFRVAPGAGTIVFEPANTDVVINGIEGFLREIDKEGGVATLKNVGDDEWDLFGLLREDVSA